MRAGTIGTFFAVKAYRKDRKLQEIKSSGPASAPRVIFLVGLLVPMCASAQTSAPKAPFSPVPHFKDVAKEAGLTVSHISTPEKKYIVESMSGGAGLIDCDNDGRLDIITVNGSTIDRYRQGGDPMITLYHQDANFKFTDITRHRGPDAQGLGNGCGRR